MKPEELLMLTIWNVEMFCQLCLFLLIAVTGCWIMSSVSARTRPSVFDIATAVFGAVLVASGAIAVAAFVVDAFTYR